MSTEATNKGRETASPVEQLVGRRRCLDKPFWKNGDVLALTNDMVRGRESIYRGCHVFQADSEPILRGDDWCFGYRGQEEFRHATAADIDRLIGLGIAEIRRVTEQETSEIERLLALKAKLK